ncbi:unnamed protein product [Mytilus coruscus]|uniref:Uncharacterized protein n=1 Tax=Mytilus coruscus TaxID=42192 RepID=A0A6J8AUD3_MYTCO|nr:unnamed protein product [Mytilus coruscus]
MEKLKNIRTGNRSAVTRFFRKFEEAKGNTDFDRVELLATYDNLTQKTKLLEKLNEQILEATDSDNVESEIVDTDEYSNNLYTKLRHFRNFIQIGQNRTPSSNVTQSSYQVHNVESLLSARQMLITFKPQHHYMLHPPLNHRQAAMALIPVILLHKL